MRLYENHKFRKHYEEFVAYRLLYSVMTKNQSAIISFLNKIDTDTLKHPAVGFAMEVRSAFLHDNYVAFLKLHDRAPMDCARLTEKMLPNIRFQALAIMARA